MDLQTYVYMCHSQRMRHKVSTVLYLKSSAAHDSFNKGNLRLSLAQQYARLRCVALLSATMQFATWHTTAQV